MCLLYYSDDEVTIIRKPKKPRSMTQHSSEGHRSPTEKSQQLSQPHLPGTPNTPEVEKSAEIADEGTAHRIPIRKIPSISSEGSQAIRKIPSISSEGSQVKGSLHKKTSVSTEGGYQASIEEDQSMSYITEQGPVTEGHDPKLTESLIAIPVNIPEQADMIPIANVESEASMVNMTLVFKFFTLVNSLCYVLHPL